MLKASKTSSHLGEVLIALKLADEWCLMRQVFGPIFAAV